MVIDAVSFQQIMLLQTDLTVLTYKMIEGLEARENCNNKYKE
jgi:hypothetical protein